MIVPMTDLGSKPDDTARRAARRSLPKKILVPTDFAEPAGAALDYAIGLAEALDAEIVILHAFEFSMQASPGAPFGIPVEIGRRLLECARAELDKTLSFHLDARIPIRACVEEGDGWRVINDVARRESADLVVMGTHGRRGLPHALLGSVAEKVVRTSTVPVLTIRTRADDDAST